MTPALALQRLITAIWQQQPQSKIIKLRATFNRLQQPTGARR